MKNKTQCEMILQYIQDFGSITTYEAFIELGITRLASRIFDLQKQNYKFDEKWISKKNKYGKNISFKEYILEKTIEK